MAGEWWDGGGFDLGGGGGGFDFGAFDPGQFNLGFDPGSFNFNFGPMPDFSSMFGAMPDFSQFTLPDPLALPTWAPPSFQPSTGGFDLGAFGQGLAAPSALPSGGGGFNLGFGQGAGAPSLALPNQTPQTTSDPLVNLQQTYTPPALGQNPQFTMSGAGPSNFFGGIPGQFDLGGGTGLPGEQTSTVGGSAYAQPPLAGLGAPVAPGLTPGGPMSQMPGLGQGFNAQGAPMSDMEKFLALQMAKTGQTPPASGWDTVAKLAAAFAPTALGAAGLGLQAANRPQRNPLEDDLLRAKIASTGQQDALARDRLQFERDQADAMRAFQEQMQGSQLDAQRQMQEALIASRRPGGQGNIQSLLHGNPQLNALYNALTTQGTRLASGDTPEFNAQVEQLAAVDIAEIQRQANQQIAQAQEMAARQGINPANIIAEIQQRVLQESAKSRANARQTLIQQLGAGMQPGTAAFNTIGGLFGNLFQTPSATGVG